MKFSFKIVLPVIASLCFFWVSCSKNNPQPNPSNTNTKGGNGNGGGTQSGGGPDIIAAVVSTVSGSQGVAGFQNTGSLYATFNSPSGTVVDASGNVFVTDTYNAVVREISANGIVTTFAGTGHVGNSNGQGSSASFNEPVGIAIDLNGNLVIADQGNNLIRKITPSGVVSTIAGTGQAGSQNGPAAAATFNAPSAIAIDKLGNIFVSDLNTALIREIDNTGNVTTIAGNGTFGHTDGAGTSASFSTPVAMALDATGKNLYVVDFVLVRKIALDGDKVTTMFDGSSTYANIDGIAIDAKGIIYLSCMPPQIIELNGTSSVLVGTRFTTMDRDVATQSSFNYPEGLSFDKNGNLFVADCYNNMIREVSPAGQVTNFAGSGNQGNANGLPVEYSFPSDVAVDKAGDIFVTDLYNNAIRKILPNGSVNTFEYHNGLTFYRPMGIKLDKAGNLFVADRGDNVIRKLAPSGAVTNYAGSGATGAADGSAAASSFDSPSSVAIDLAGNVFVADATNNQIRKISTSGIVTTLAGNHQQGAADGPGNTASFNDPVYITLDNQGNILVADAGNHSIRKVTPAGIVSTVAVRTSNGIGTPPAFDTILGLAVDAYGNIFVSDADITYTHQVSEIRVISPNGVETILAGGTTGWLDGPGSSAEFNEPCGLAIDADGNLLVADEFNDVIRKITITRK